VTVHGNAATCALLLPRQRSPSLLFLPLAVGKFPHIHTDRHAFCLPEIMRFLGFPRKFTIVGALPAILGIVWRSMTPFLNGGRAETRRISLGKFPISPCLASHPLLSLTLHAFVLLGTYFSNTLEFFATFYNFFCYFLCFNIFFGFYVFFLHKKYVISRVLKANPRPLTKTDSTRQCCRSVFLIYRSSLKNTSFVYRNIPKEYPKRSRSQ